MQFYTSRGYGAGLQSSPPIHLAQILQEKELQNRNKDYQFNLAIIISLRPEIQLVSNFPVVVDIIKMRRRTNSLSVKVKALESLKKISEECYDLTSPALTTPTKPLLCQVDPFNRTSALIDSSPIVQRSAPVSNTARSITFHEPRLTSAFDIGSPLVETEAFCKKVYTTKLIETQAKENDRQKSLFVRKLMKAVTGDVLNASGYELGPLGVREITDFLQKTNMVELALDRNNLKDQGVMELVKVAARLSLKRLSLASVGMTERSCKPLITQLANMHSLEELNIGSYEGFNRNRLHKEAFENISHLTSVGAGKTNLKVLKCGGVGLDDSNFKALCLGLGRGSRLQVLSVEENEITSEGMNHFKEHAVKLHLHFLDLSGNKIDGGGLLELASLIGSDYNLTKISKALHTIKASRGKIRSGTLATFAKSMPNNQTLQQLYLDGNPLGEGGKFNTFTNFLSRCWCIKKLSLCQSLRSTDEILMLCDSLESNRGVQTLIISRNSLEYCAFKKLIDMLSRNKSLKRVHIESCGIVDSYVLRAEESILQLKYLEELYLDHNFLNDNAAHIIEKAIYRNKSLVRVQLHNNSLGVKMQQQVQRALMYNKEVKKFDGPDLSYYTHVEEQQTQQKNALNNAIQELRQKENQLNCKHLVHAIAKRDLESTSKATEVQKEAVEVQKISELRESLQKMQEMERKAQMKESGERPINNSMVSMGEMSNFISRQISELSNEEAYVSQVSSNLEGTH